MKSIATSSKRRSIRIWTCAAVAAATLFALSSRASATTCTFTSSGDITYDSSLSGQSLKFTWDTTTGAVSYDAGTCNSSNGDMWDDYQGGHNYYCGYATDPGTIGGGSLDTSSSTLHSLVLQFDLGGGVVYTFTGYLAGHGHHAPSNPVSFIAIVSSTSSGDTNIINGVGAVSCS